VRRDKSERKKKIIIILNAQKSFFFSIDLRQIHLKLKIATIEIKSEWVREREWKKERKKIPQPFHLWLSYNSTVSIYSIPRTSKRNPRSPHLINFNSLSSLTRSLALDTFRKFLIIIFHFSFFFIITTFFFILLSSSSSLFKSKVFFYSILFNLIRWFHKCVLFIPKKREWTQ
jgi:hypothetical protein